MNRAAWILTFILTACSSGSPRSTPQARPEPVASSHQAQAREFVDRMLDALDREDPNAWWDLLSTRMRQRLGSPAAAHDHLATWHRDVFPLAATLRVADVAVDPKQVVTYATDGAPPSPLAMVALEAGVLRLDEN